MSLGRSQASNFSDVAVAGGIVSEEHAPQPTDRVMRLLGLDLQAPVLIGIVVLAAAYYAAAAIGYELEFSGPIAAVVWLPVGVGITFLYFGGLRLWPGVLVGDILANNYGALPVGSALGQTVGNLLEVVVATVLLHRLVPRGSPLASVGGLLRMLVAIGSGAAISATVGPLALLLGGAVTADSLPEVWRTWWLGDFTGALVVVPLALAWWPPAPIALKHRKVEAFVLLLTVVAVSEIASRSAGSWAYLSFCALIWAALRFGTRGASLGTLIVVAFTVWNTMHYDGPFASGSLTRSVVTTQLFIAVAALSTLCLAAVVYERERIAEQLGRSRARLIDAADSERRRIERNLHDGAQQRLVALAMQFNLAGEEAAAAPGQAGRLLQHAAEELQLALDELRELAQGIHPSVLSHLGLADAIRSLAARSSAPVSLRALSAARVDATAEATAYYVVAEAVANAQKHARGSHIHIRASYGEGLLTVEVADDGPGGAVEDTGTGLVGLRDRVEATGGTLQIESPPGHGTRIRALIPAVVQDGAGAPGA
ncbi:MAG TPA: sensor histidine kinase [Gaiellales bacterium]|nr:sensor histidine kinase [Gaiellales bacterium]